MTRPRAADLIEWPQLPPNAPGAYCSSRNQPMRGGTYCEGGPVVGIVVRHRATGNNGRLVTWRVCAPHAIEQLLLGHTVRPL